MTVEGKTYTRRQWVAAIAIGVVTETGTIYGSPPAGIWAVCHSDPFQNVVWFSHPAEQRALAGAPAGPSWIPV